MGIVLHTAGFLPSARATNPTNPRTILPKLWFAATVATLTHIWVPLMLHAAKKTSSILTGPVFCS